MKSTTFMFFYVIIFCLNSNKLITFFSHERLQEQRLPPDPSWAVTPASKFSELGRAASTPFISGHVSLALPEDSDHEQSPQHKNIDAADDEEFDQISDIEPLDSSFEQDPDPYGLQTVDPADASYRPSNQSNLSYTKEQSINKRYVDGFCLYIKLTVF